MSTLPSGVRGTFFQGYGSHCAMIDAGRAITMAAAGRTQLMRVRLVIITIPQLRFFEGCWLQW
jgi:hypothetical protein